MIYLNHHATSFPKPELVLRAVQQQLVAAPHCSRSSNPSTSVLGRCREKVAQFFGLSNAQDVIFTSGSTEALNLAILGLDAPKHIISTLIEHNSVIRPLKHLERDQGVALSWIAADQEGFISLAELEAAIRPETSAIVVNHASNVSGAIQDLAAISKIARAHNIPLIVDASQSAGAIPIDLSKIHIDAFAFTAHKSLYGIRGFGGLILKPELKLRPLKTGGTGSRSDYLYQPEERPHLYEAGTSNYLGAAALIAGIQYVEAIGFQESFQHKYQLSKFVWDALQAEEHIHCYGGAPSKHKLPVLNLSVDGFSADDLSYILSASFDIIGRAGLHCAPFTPAVIKAPKDGTLRLSFGYSNSLEEAEKLIQILKEVATQAKTISL